MEESGFIPLELVACGYDQSMISSARCPTDFVFVSMARTCSVCGRGAMNSATRSHSNIATKRKQHLNLQTLLSDGKRVKACSSCIRSNSKKLASATK